MKRRGLVIFFCLIVADMYAQDLFVVYSTKGEVTMAEKRKSVIVKAGQIISPNSSVIIAENAGITLIYKGGSFYSVTKPGSYSLNQLIDSCKKSSTVILNNFMRYLWDQAIEKKYGRTGQNRKTYFDRPHVTHDQFTDVWIDYQAFDTTNYSGISGNFGFYWLTYVKAKEYEFSLYAAPNTATPFYKKIVKELRMPFVDIAAQIKPGNSYYWTVTVRGDEENDNLFVLNYVTKESFDSVLSNISKQRPLVESLAEEAYRTAFMLEYVHYLAEAYQHYTKAADLEATNTLYKSTLISFKKDFKIK